jgi:superfamily II DNA or RNA helicase
MNVDFAPEGLLLRGFDVHAPHGVTPLAAAVLAAWSAGADGFELREDGLLLSAAALRNLAPEVLAELGVHALPGTVRVREVGLTGRPGYRWELLWDGEAGLPYGVWLQRAGRLYLMDEARLTLARLAGEVEGATREEVFRRVSELQELTATGAGIDLKGKLSTRRIHFADAVRIGVQQNGANGKLTPVAVLSSKNATGTAPLPLGEAGQRVVEDQLRLDGCIVPLGDGVSVVVSADVARAAMVTQLAAHANDEDRTRFLANPAALLPNPDVFDEKDYADRVIGAGFAPRGGSASAKATGRDWAEDPGGVLIDTSLGEVWVPSGDLQRLHDELVDAVREGKPELVWDGKAIPTRPGVVDALAEAIRTPRGGAEQRGEDGKPRPRILLIRENDISLAYQRYRRGSRTGVVGGVPGLRRPLRAHQLEGVGALQRLWVEGWSGALLCDDMGLGKTMQALAFAAWARRHMPDVDVPIVVVAPPSLLGPWLQEMTDKLDDDLLPRIIWGPRDPPPQGVPRQVQRLEDFLIGETRSTSPVLANVSIDLPRLRAAKPDVLFVGYDALRRYQFALGKLHFGCVIADEAQEAKDPNSLRSRALRAMNYEFALVLTGTPIENAWRDLWTLCDVAVPGMLGTLRQFGQEYTSESDVRSTGEKLAQELSRVLIRRTRATTLADLPPREVKVVQREMSPEQSLAYQSALSRRSGGNAPILGLLGDLSRISLHPRIRTDLRSKEEALEWVGASARTSVAWEALARFARERTAVLVFVRSLAMQSSLQRALQLTFGLADVPVLNGSAPPSTRVRMVDQMRRSTGFRVMLVSPEVGGAGWNLQFANRVVILERPWNPAVESQMIARVHRLGQDRPVEIVVPVATLATRRTYDVILDELLTEKTGLAEAVLAPASMGEDELAGRFKREFGEMG